MKNQEVNNSEPVIAPAAVARTNWPALIILSAVALGVVVTWALWPTKRDGIETTPPPPLPEGEGIPSGWQTYRNNEYGFEIQYPAELIQNIEKTKPEVKAPLAPEAHFSLTTIAGSTHTFTLDTNPASLDYFNQLYGEVVDIDRISKDRIPNIRIKKLIYDGGYADYFLFDPTTKRIARFLFGASQSSAGEFEQILSTFRFFDVDSDPVNQAGFDLSNITDSWLIGETKQVFLSHDIPVNDFNVARSINVVDESGKVVGILACAKSEVPKEIIWDAHTLMNFCGAATWGREQAIHKEGLYKLRLSNPPNPDMDSRYFRIAYPSEQRIVVYPDGGSGSLIMKRASQMNQQPSLQPRFYFSWIAGPTIPRVNLWLRNIACGNYCQDVLVAENLNNENSYWWKLPDDFPVDEKFILEVSSQIFSSQRLIATSKQAYMLASDENFTSPKR